RDPDGDGFSGAGGPPFPPAGGLGAWAPGIMTRPLPEGTGMMLPAKTDIVVQMHYHPTGKEEEDLSQVGIYFTKSPAKNLVAGLTAMNQGLRIPAGAKDHHVSAQTQPLPVPVQATGLLPHMHLLGKEMKAVAHLPGGAQIQLVNIKSWDFNWQNIYIFEKS